MSNKPPTGKNQKRRWLEELGGTTFMLIFMFLILKIRGIDLSDFLRIMLNTVIQIGWMFFFALASVAIVGLVILVQAVMGKCRKVKVFLSYQHEHAALVEKLGFILDTKWIVADFIPFAAADHDVIIEKVQKSILESDLLIILPGLEKSFVDSEIMLASALKKPIIFLKTREDQRIPDTSYRGYPVFDLQKLDEFQFEPLKRFVLYVSNSSKDVFQNFPRSLAAFKKEFTSGIPILGVLFVLFLLGGFILLFFNDLELEAKFARIIYWMFTAISVGYFLFFYLKVLTERIRAINITRQTIRTGNMTYDELSRCFAELEADIDILRCINEKPLATNH